MDDDNWIHLPPESRDRIKAGVEALARIHQHRDFHDWHLVGQACLDMQQAIMTAAEVDKPTGRAYSTMFGKFIDAYPQYTPLAKIDESVRSNAIWMAQNWDTVSEWHDELEIHIRRLVNHPTTVRRRFKLDKQIHKPAPPPKDESKEDPEEDYPGEDEEEESEEETKPKRDKPIHDPAEDDPDKVESSPPPGLESYLADFERLWQHVKDHWNHGTSTARAEMTKRIMQWLHDMEEVPDNTRVETNLIDEIIHDSIQSVNKTDGSEITAMTRRKADITASGEAQPEHTALVVRDALTKPIIEGEDIFAGLDNDLNAKEVTPELIRALRPATTISESKVLALHYNNPSWDDATLAKEVKTNRGKPYLETTVRHVLDKFRKEETTKRRLLDKLLQA
jgi:hypothetical protein